MKTKKVISSILLTLTLLAGGLSQTHNVSAALDKEQAVSIVKKGSPETQSAGLNATFNVKVNKEKPIILKINSELKINPALAHVTLETSYGKKTSETEEMWASEETNRLYSKNKGKWEYTTLPKPSKKKPKGAEAQLFNLLSDPKTYTKTSDLFIKALDDNSELSGPDQDGVYTLTVNVSAPKMKKLFLEFYKKAKFSKKEIKEFKKSVKFTNIQFAYTIKDEKLVGYTGNVTLKLAKLMKFSETISTNHFDGYNDLKLPDEVINAKKAKSK